MGSKMAAFKYAMNTSFNRTTSFKLWTFKTCCPLKVWVPFVVNSRKLRSIMTKTTKNASCDWMSDSMLKYDNDDDSDDESSIKSDGCLLLLRKIRWKKPMLLLLLLLLLLSENSTNTIAKSPPSWKEINNGRPLALIVYYWMTSVVSCVWARNGQKRRPWALWRVERSVMMFCFIFYYWIDSSSTGMRWGRQSGSMGQPATK